MGQKQGLVLGREGTAYSTSSKGVSLSVVTPVTPGGWETNARSPEGWETNARSPAVMTSTEYSFPGPLFLCHIHCHSLCTRDQKGPHVLLGLIKLPLVKRIAVISVCLA